MTPVYDYAWFSNKNCYAVFNTACRNTAVALCASTTDAELVKSALNQATASCESDESDVEDEDAPIPSTRELFALA